MSDSPLYLMMTFHLALQYVSILALAMVYWLICVMNPSLDLSLLIVADCRLDLPVAFHVALQLGSLLVRTTTFPCDSLMDLLTDLINLIVQMI